MRKLALSLLVVMMFVFSLAFSVSAEEAATETEAPAAAVSEAEAEEFDFLSFAVERVLPDFHPTVKIEDAQADFDERPYDKGDGITRARVGIYYSGWIRKHSMLVEMDLRREDRKIRISVLKDTNGTNLVGNRFFKEGEWVSIAAMGWK